jgi:hypothetical protein
MGPLARLMAGSKRESKVARLAAGRKTSVARQTKPPAKPQPARSQRKKKPQRPTQEGATAAGRAQEAAIVTDTPPEPEEPAHTDSEEEEEEEEGGAASGAAPGRANISGLMMTTSLTRRDRRVQGMPRRSTDAFDEDGGEGEDGDGEAGGHESARSSGSGAGSSGGSAAAAARRAARREQADAVDSQRAQVQAQLDRFRNR